MGTLVVEPPQYPTGMSGKILPAHWTDGLLVVFPGALIVGVTATGVLKLSTPITPVLLVPVVPDIGRTLYGGSDTYDVVNWRLPPRLTALKFTPVNDTLGVLRGEAVGDCLLRHSGGSTYNQEARLGVLWPVSSDGFVGTPMVTSFSANPGDPNAVIFSQDPSEITVASGSVLRCKGYWYGDDLYTVTRGSITGPWAPIEANSGRWNPNLSPTLSGATVLPGAGGQAGVFTIIDTPIGSSGPACPQVVTVDPENGSFTSYASPLVGGLGRVGGELVWTAYGNSPTNQGPLRWWLYHLAAGQAVAVAIGGCDGSHLVEPAVGAGTLATVALRRVTGWAWNATGWTRTPPAGVDPTYRPVVMAETDPEHGDWGWADGNAEVYTHETALIDATSGVMVTGWVPNTTMVTPPVNG